MINALNIDSFSPISIGRKSKKASIEVLIRRLRAEFMSIDGENGLFRQVSNVDIPNLIERFMINGNYAKAFCGFKTRMLSKISAVTLIQDMSKFLSERNIKNIKIQII
ncbi:MAG: hypothetical protein ACTMH4_02270 [Sphingobacterium sp.]